MRDVNRCVPYFYSTWTLDTCLSGLSPVGTGSVESNPPVHMRDKDPYIEHLDKDPGKGSDEGTGEDLGEDLDEDLDKDPDGNAALV